MATEVEVATVVTVATVATEGTEVDMGVTRVALGAIAVVAAGVEAMEVTGVTGATGAASGSLTGVRRVPVGMQHPGLGGLTEGTLLVGLIEGAAVVADRTTVGDAAVEVAVVAVRHGDTRRAPLVEC